MSASKHKLSDYFNTKTRDLIFEICKSYVNKNNLLYNYVKKTNLLDISKSSMLYHYTVIDALVNGMIQKDNFITMWVTNCKHMNDPKEMETGKNAFANMFKEFTEDAYKALPPYFKQENNYLISFSAQKDNLPMWTTYGNNGRGVSLGFDAEKLNKAFEGGLLNCIYVKDDVAEKIFDVYNNASNLIKEDSNYIEVRKSLFDNKLKEIEGINYEEIIESNSQRLLDTYIPLLIYNNLFFSLKHKAYEYESEVRAITNGIKLRELRYRTRKGIVIPYYETKLPKETLKEIWIGPTNNIKETASSLRSFLDNNGFEHVVIKESEIPYRD